MFAALIGSWDDPSRPADAPYEMLAQAVEYLDSNTDEPIIGLRQCMMSPQTMLQHYNMGFSFDDIMDEPRLLLRDEEATLHSLAGGLNTVIDVYDVGAKEIVTFRPNRDTPTSTRWIVRYPNGTYGAALDREAMGSGPAVPQDRDREEVQREPTRPGEAQGAGHYTQSLSTETLTDDILGPTRVGDTSGREHGLGLVIYNTDGLDFHRLNKLLCWLQQGLAGGMYLTDVRCTGREKDRWTASVKAALGPHAKLYMAAIKPRVRTGN